MKLLGQMLYFWLYAVGALLEALPWPVKRASARVLGFLWFRVFRFRRHIVLHNLALVFPRRAEESMSDFKKRSEHLAQKNCEHYVLLFFEILERFHWTEETLKRRVTIHGQEHLQRVIDSREGGFFLTAHLGNWEVITWIGVLTKTRLAIITKFLRNPFFDALWVKSRERFGLELLPERNSGLAVLRAVRSGKMVGFIADQHTGLPHGKLSQFLGQAAWTPVALTLLALRLRCPVVPAYLLRNEHGNFDLFVEAPLPQGSQNSDSRGESAAPDDQTIDYHLRLCNANMEKWIRRAPEQYLWLHKRFKNFLDYRQPLPWQL